MGDDRGQQAPNHEERGPGPGRHGSVEGLLPVEQALRIVAEEAKPLDPEEVPLEGALGRVLAETVRAPADIPALDRSAMDGYALRSIDLSAIPAELSVVGFLPAGRSGSDLGVGTGEALRIMTGAPLPPGADAVQMIEKTEDLEDGRKVRILSAVARGENVFHQGEDVKRGDVVLAEGAWVRPPEVGALAAVGRVRLRVRRHPRILLLSTGDEIVDAGAEPQPHQIRNSNGPALLAAMVAEGFGPVSLGISRDDPRDLDRKIADGLAGDLFVLIGGVSVGDRDLVSERLLAAGVSVLFHRIAMKPGKPLLFGRKGRCLVFGLPGNPQSALTDFFVFVLPALRALVGLPAAGLSEVTARLTERVHQKPGRTWYRLARIVWAEGRFEATPVRSSGSGDLVAATRANGFLVVPSDATEILEGGQVKALLWPGFEIA